MKFLNYTLATLALTLLSVACVQPPDYPNEPQISFLQLNQNIIAQGNINAQPDTLEVIFEFQDGDGDLGFTNDSIDVFLADSRDDFVNRFKLPFIPDQGTGNGISGKIILRIPNTPFNICCTFPDNSTACQPNAEFPIDTFSYTIQIRDRAGNYSNKIQTETITVLCQ